MPQKGKTRCLPSRSRTKSSTKITDEEFNAEVLRERPWIADLIPGAVSDLASRILFRRADQGLLSEAPVDEDGTGPSSYSVRRTLTLHGPDGRCILQHPIGFYDWGEPHRDERSEPVALSVERALEMAAQAGSELAWIVLVSAEDDRGVYAVDITMYRKPRHGWRHLLDSRSEEAKRQHRLAAGESARGPYDAFWSASRVDACDEYADHFVRHWADRDPNGFRLLAPHVAAVASVFAEVAAQTCDPCLACYGRPRVDRDAIEVALTAFRHLDFGCDGELSATIRSLVANFSGFEESECENHDSRREVVDAAVRDLDAEDGIDYERAHGNADEVLLGQSWYTFRRPRR